MIRKKIRESAFQDTEQRKEPKVNTAVLRMNRSRSHRRSPNHPTEGMRTVRVIMNPVRTHWILLRETPSEDMMLGIAMSTAVRVRATDNVPRKRVKETHHLCTRSEERRVGKECRSRW